MFKILLACDGSSGALHAAGFVANLCQEVFAESEITVLCAKDLNMATLGLDTERGTMILPSTAEMQRSIDTIGENSLRRAAEVLRDIGRPLVLRTEWGRAADVICSIAEGENFDLVVMGRRGTGPIRGILLGSVSDRVLRCCSVPVLVVPEVRE